MKTKRGFTLIEILLVVAAIAILAGIVILAINPTKQLADTRNAKRQSDVTTILNAVYQYAIDNNGNLPGGVTSGTGCGVTTQEICQSNVSGPDCTTANLSFLQDDLVGTTAKYLVSIPADPKSATANSTKYEVFKDGTTNRVTVCAPEAEQGKTIEVTR